jgi:hypothetical protein
VIEYSWIEWAFKGCVSIGSTLLVGFTKFMHDKIEKLEAKQIAAEKDLLGYKLEAERTYAKQSDLHQAVTRIESLSLEMRTDIKSLIAKNGFHDERH